MDDLIFSFRYVFTLADLDTVAPAYDYFVERLKSHEQSEQLVYHNIDIDFPQYFCYDRTTEMTLIEISL